MALTIYLYGMIWTEYMLRRDASWLLSMPFYALFEIF